MFKSLRVVIPFLAVIIVLNLVLNENLNYNYNLKDLSTIRKNEELKSINSYKQKNVSINKRIDLKEVLPQKNEELKKVITYKQQDFSINKGTDLKETLPEKPNEFETSSKTVKSYTAPNVVVNNSQIIHFPNKVIKNRSTKINLRRSKYLLPILFGGPNNQLIGLRESVYIAIQLNRTLVLPLFRKHRTDNRYVVILVSINLLIEF